MPPIPANSQSTKRIGATLSTFRTNKSLWQKPRSWAGAGRASLRSHRPRPQPGDRGRQSAPSRSWRTSARARYPSRTSQVGSALAR
jgi:hypothetical protein